VDTIKQIIDKFSLISKKSLGQNFILDENITDKIVRFSDIKDQFVLEIGPGPGCLTRSLIKAGAKKIIAVEKDSKCVDMINYQKKIFLNKVMLIEGDFLKDYVFKKILKEVSKHKKKSYYCFKSPI
jgi:16S rRNA (adenine1518-N6/adenine1519-N6)-dimethyltransferase